ncbi:MAG TPA: carboxypeptidase-like regulatory domain-containing protein, partial [Gemmataceae bacterium]|nr:carboxypeptidase-like regulatory domain-containing protein [Gemmataceae bacterium]
MKHRSVVLLAALVSVAWVAPVLAAEHQGQVLLAGVPVPGVVITAIRDDKKLTASTDQRGLYRFPDLADGVWTMRAEMLGFAPVSRQVTVATGEKPQMWELTVRAFTDITREVPITRVATASTAGRAAPARRSNTPPSTATPATLARAGGAGAAPAVPGAPAGSPGAGRPGGPGPSLADAAAAGPAASGNSFLVSGTVNSGTGTPSIVNGQTLDAARRAAGLRLYNLTVTSQFGGSMFDSKPPSFTGRPPTQPDYHDLNFGAQFSGPMRIPRLMRTSKNVQLGYNRTSNSNASTLSEQMPSLLQRIGDFSQTVDGFGRPVQIVDPATGLPFAGNVIPRDRISPQAAALLGYYPLADLGATGTYNYQVPSLSEQESDRVTGSLSQLMGNNRYNLGVNGGYSHNRSQSTSLFGFQGNNHGSSIDVGVTYQFRTGNTSNNRIRYSYSRQQSENEPFFANRINVSGLAGITGNNQDPENWGPPTLTFSSGIAGLSDSQYSLNRTQSHAWNGEMQRTIGRHNIAIGGDLRR